MGIGGIYEYDKYNMLHQGCNASEHNAQGTEMFIGKFKQHARMKGSGKHNMIDLITEHIDMTGTCSIYNGQINLRKIINEILQKEIQVCPQPATSQIENALEALMSPLMKFFVSSLNKFEIGDQIPDVINRVNACNRLAAYKLKHEAILQLLKKSKFKKIYVEDNVDSAEYQEVEKQWEKRHGQRRSNV